MRHRIRVSLYDNNPVDAEILDYLVDMPNHKKQEILRMFLATGFNTIIKRFDSEDAIAKSIDPMIMGIMSGAIVSKDTVKKTRAPKKKAVVSKKKSQPNDIKDVDKKELKEINKNNNLENNVTEKTEISVVANKNREAPSVKEGFLKKNKEQDDEVVDPLSFLVQS